VERNWFSKLAAAVRDTRGMLTIARRMDGRLTLHYYFTAFMAALAPTASGLALAGLIDSVIVISLGPATIPILITAAVATRFAIDAVSAAIRFALHEQYCDYLFRYRLQDTFTYQFCDKLTRLDVGHLEDSDVQALITRVRSTHRQLPDFFRILACALIAAVGVLSAATGLAWAAVSGVGSGPPSVGSFAFLVTMLHQLATGTADAAGAIRRAHENLRHVRDWNELMAVPRLIPHAERPHRFAGVRPPHIELRGVSFADPSGREVVRDVSFTIEPGESVALVGSLGTGTTLIKLLCRFHDVTGGQILINGVDLRELDLDHWHAHLGTALQPFLQYKLAAACDLVRELRGGDPQVRGTEPVDRAFYQSAPVLILDPPTGAIDAGAEVQIFNDLRAEYRDKTLLVVSHRLSTARNADSIVVLDDGRIVERGSHEQLLARGGRYATMLALQAGAYR
jgi:ABC-type multidrug transport system fused ATPase/permease subunit